jgi:DNA-binding transcriptional LysR family regulator
MRGGGLPQTHWPRAGGGNISVKGSFVSNDINLILDAAVRGLGIAVLPTLLVGGLLERRALVRVLPELIHAESRVSVVFQEKELLPPQVRAFIDVLVAWVPTALDAARNRRWLPKPEVQAKPPLRAKRPARRSRINRR